MPDHPDRATIRDESRDQAARSLRDVRRTYAGSVFMAVAGAALLRSIGPRGDVLADLPSLLRLGIPTVLLVMEALAYLTYFTIPGQVVRAIAHGIRRASRSEALNRETVRDTFFMAYALMALARMFVLLVAVMLAGIVFRVTGRPWALVNFAGTIIIVVVQLPTRARMDRWTSRRVADFLEMAPMPDDPG